MGLFDDLTSLRNEASVVTDCVTVPPPCFPELIKADMLLEIPPPAKLRILVSDCQALASDDVPACLLEAVRYEIAKFEPIKVISREPVDATFLRVTALSWDPLCDRLWVLVPLAAPRESRID